MNTCPTCGDNFDTQRGLSIHHSRAHGERIDKEEYISDCPSCDRSFKSKRGMRSHHTKVHGESISGELVECANCGKEKREKPYKLEQVDRFFCDQDCHGEWRSENLTGDKHWSYKAVVNECQYCDEEYHVQPSRSELSSFCSSVCQKSWQSKNWRGENAPAWKGGYNDYYGWSYKSRRRDIQKRDDDVCQKCGFESDETLAVHHIVPVREFDDPNVAHFDKNMYQVCKECHLELEQMGPLKQAEILGGAA